MKNFYLFEKGIFSEVDLAGL